MNWEMDMNRSGNWSSPNWDSIEDTTTSKDYTETTPASRGIVSLSLYPSPAFLRELTRLTSYNKNTAASPARLRTGHPFDSSILSCLYITKTPWYQTCLPKILWAQTTAGISYHTMTFAGERREYFFRRSKTWNCLTDADGTVWEMMTSPLQQGTGSHMTRTHVETELNW